MNYLKNLPFLLFITALIFSFWGCKDIYDQEKYQIPDWVEGKITTQIKGEEGLTIFIECLEATGYDSILNTSGSYTVFAPTDEAFNLFFQENGYSSVSDIASEELKALVEYQIIYNAWSKEQFKNFDVDGWVFDPKDKLIEQKAYKQRTLYRKDNKPYPAKRKGNKYTIASSSEATASKTAYTQSNKFSPVFFREYLHVYDLTGNDYEYYFNRPVNADNLYYANAELSEGIPAENGFIYKTDRVVAPLPTGAEILENEYDNHSYKDFLSLIYDFSEFNTNVEATFNQPGADAGLEVDTLYNLSYPDLLFNINNELTGNTFNQKFTYREHHGIMAPTDQAIESFISEYLSGWNNLEDLPVTIKRIIVNAHMSKDAVYPSNIERGFRNGEGDWVTLNEANIIQKNYGSNCSFLGLDKMIIPRVIASVCKPMFLTREYQTMMYACEKTKVLSALKKPNANYSFYLPTDRGIGMGGDSSLIRIVDNRELDLYHFEAYDRSRNTFTRMDINFLKRKILNQIGVSQPVGLADIEFIENLGGNYITVNNKEGTVGGNSASTFGFNGDSIIDINVDPYTQDTDNGKVFIVDNWFNFSVGNSYYGLFQSRYPKFLGLLDKAGLYNTSLYNFPFLIDGEFYTVFAPSDEALEAYGVDELSVEELREFLQYHFIIGDIIFTDGNKPEGVYNTTRIDESSTASVTNYSTLHIKPTPDFIQLMDKEGNVYLEVQQQEGSTNQMISYDTNKSSDSRWDYITTGVVHTIDKVLIKDSLQAN
jgi:uncharacterized surface protein with fasciclin (FAS1) repeats